MTKEELIKELEEPILCHKCNDHIDGDGAICGICASTQDTVINELETHIDELKAALSKAAHMICDCSGSCPSDVYDWEHPNLCINECDKYNSPDDVWKCWSLWLLKAQEEK